MKDTPGGWWRGLIEVDEGGRQTSTALITQNINVRRYFAFQKVTIVETSPESAAVPASPV